MESHVSRARLTRKSFLGPRCRLHHEEAKARQHIAVVFLLEQQLGAVTKGDEVPKRSHFRKVVGKEVLMQLFQKCLKLLVHVFHRAPMEQYKVEHFGSLGHILFPLSESRA